MISIAMINKHHDQKQFIGQRVYFTSQITIYQWGKSQHEPGGKAGTEVEAIDEYPFLALSSQLAQSAFL